MMEEGSLYWRSVRERLRTREYEELAAREFTPDELARPALSRRDFLRLLGASAALAGATACERPVENILPYTDQPPEVTPGIPQYYATSTVLDGYATGVLVESQGGRPIKVEGHPEHPASLGAAGVHEQASVLELYDPQRPAEIRHGDAPATWTDLMTALRPITAGQGDGLHFLLEPTSSPLLFDLLARVQARYPAARIYFDAPLAADGAWEGTRRLFGRPLQTHLDLAAADVIVSLDADFLATGPFHLRHSRAWADRRRLTDPTATMNRLYMAEGALSVTGAAADERLRARPGDVHLLAAALLAALALEHGLGAGLADGDRAALATIAGESSGLTPETVAWIRAAAADLASHAGRSLVIAGERQPAEVHALAALANLALGSFGRTVSLSEPVVAGAGDPNAGLEALADELRQGRVQTLVIVGADPAYTAPTDLDFAALLDRIPTAIALDLRETETTRRCDWFIPSHHSLESWGDARAYDGTISLIQPLIRPLRPASRGATQLLAAFLGQPDASSHDLLTSYWRTQHPAADFDAWWEESLHRGFFPGTESPRVDPPMPVAPLADLLPVPLTNDGGIEVVFPASYGVHDGRFANNAWLLELPDPITKLTWDNAAIVSPATAADLGIDTSDVLEISRRENRVRAPAFIIPGVADGVIVLPLGYGHDWGDLLGSGVGFDAYRLRTTDSAYFARDLEVQTTGERYPLATTQDHATMVGRPIALHASLAEFRENPNVAKRLAGNGPSLYQPPQTGGVQWGMSIDLSVCTGCSACVVACQAENNIPTVGKDAVRHSREMHWLRIDRYFSGDESDPAVLMQPMLCQHCEKAPCEYVCPVNATVHSPDGLNEMVYNRCVGTRFCSNNCPYKVRRFNWFDFNEVKRGTTLEMQLNPDVTVRERGVMEKCSFCVQRIRGAEIQAGMAGESVEDHEFQTACQQACPTRAIEFGPLTKPTSPVARQRNDPRSYAVLNDLGTQPRVRYLVHVDNPNPQLHDGGSVEEAPHGGPNG